MFKKQSKKSKPSESPHSGPAAEGMLGRGPRGERPIRGRSEGANEGSAGVDGARAARRDVRRRARKLRLDGEPDKRGGSKPAVRTALSKKFTPQFWDEVDGRLEVMKRIKKRLKALRTDAGVDSYQKDIICQRAVFQILRLETMEAAALKGEPFDQGTYTQAVNSLVGRLRTLGFAKAKGKGINLQDYLAGKEMAGA